MKKEFGVYRHNQFHGRKGMWERVRKFDTAEKAMQSIIDLTKKPKKDRVFVYVILPSTDRERWVLIREHEQLLASAR